MKGRVRGRVPWQTTVTGIYIRVSSPGQADGASLETQERACRDWLAEHQASGSIERYREIHTGTELWERPELTRLRADARAGRLTRVICYTIDRLSRDPVHLGVIISELEHAGVELVFVQDVFDDSPEGQLIRFVRGYAAKVEHEKIRERSLRGRRARAEAGKLPPSPRPRYGYQWADQGRTRYIIDPERAAVVRRIFQDVVKGVTLHQIARTLAEDGIPSPTGSETWHVQTVARIVRHPYYRGEGEFTLAGVSYVIPAGAVPAIVEPDFWDAAQLQVARNKKRSLRNNRQPVPALLRGGFARCGYCGYAMHANGGNTSMRYICGNHTTFPVRCDGVRIDGLMLDDAIWNWIVERLGNPALIEEELARLRADDPTSDDLAELDRREADIERQEGNLTRALARLAAVQAEAPVLAELERLAKQRAALNREREEVLARQASWQRSQEDLAGLAAWTRHVEAKLEGMTYEERRWLLEVINLEVTVYRADDAEHPRWVLTCDLPADPIVSPTTCRAPSSSRMPRGFPPPAR